MDRHVVKLSSKHSFYALWLTPLDLRHKSLFSNANSEDQSGVKNEFELSPEQGICITSSKAQEYLNKGTNNLRGRNQGDVIQKAVLCI